MDTISRILGESDKPVLDRVSKSPDIGIETKDSYNSFLHARDILRDRWPEGEVTILKSQDPYVAYLYARDVIGGRWPEAESFIVRDPDYAYWYAKFVVKGRWPEAEKFIASDAQFACDYSTNVVKKRWPEIEKMVADSDWRDRYLERFPDAAEDWVLAGWIDWMDT